MRGLLIRDRKGKTGGNKKREKGQKWPKRKKGRKKRRKGNQWKFLIFRVSSKQGSITASDGTD